MTNTFLGFFALFFITDSALAGMFSGVRDSNYKGGTGTSSFCTALGFGLVF